MLTRYVLADLWRNPRRTASTMVGVTLGVGLFCGVLFFVDGLSASMTQRAVAGLTTDMQRVVDARVASGVELQEDVTETDPGSSTVTLTVANAGDFEAREVTLRATLGPDTTYVDGSARLDGTLVDAPPGTNPLSSGETGAGLNIGTVDAAAERRLTFDVTHAAGSAPAVSASFSTRELVNPVPADQPPTLPLRDLADRVAAIDGVARAEPLSIGALADSTLSGGSGPAPGPARIFGFDDTLAADDPAIRAISGGFDETGAVLSVEAATSLDLGVGDTVAVDLPDGTVLELPVVGTADLSAARALFSSRRGGDLETFQYVPLSLVVSADRFAHDVQPAFERAARSGTSRLKSPPVREVAITLDRDLLDADPATALAETRAIAGEVQLIASHQSDYLLDNVSNTLAVAADDADVAKKLFVFLGLPGALLAAMLAAYAGNVLAESQRREHAILRIRGASRRQLLQMLALHTVVITAAGAVIGVTLGFAATTALLGTDTIARANRTDLTASAWLGTTAGFAATGLALYLTARRSVHREISGDRAHLSTAIPLWRRAHLDIVIAAAAIAGTVIALRGAAFEGTPGSVYFGRAADLNLRLLALPVAAWIGGALLSARLTAAILARTSPTSTPTIRPLLPRLARLSSGRRPWPIANAAIILALITSLTTTLASFTASYDHAKQQDARYAVGADIAITPNPAEATTITASDLASDRTPDVTPIQFATSNVILTSARTSDPANLAAIEPDGYLAIAPLHDDHFIGTTAPDALGDLSRDPTAILLSEDMAAFLKTGPGDSIDVLLARATPQQTLRRFHITGLFTRLPGFPDGADALIDLRAATTAIPNGTPDFFLANAAAPGERALAAAVADLGAGPDGPRDVRIQTRDSALDTDQSSLAALNIDGLVSLDNTFATGMAVVAIVIFVFGLLLHRRREYIALRAQGLPARAVRRLVIAEAATAATLGAGSGVLVGTAMGAYFVAVLRPLFVLPPSYVVPATAITTPLAVAAAAAVTAAIAGAAIIQRLDPLELLRDG